MTVQKASKPSKPSKPTIPSNLLGFIGIAVGLMAAGTHVKPFISNLLSLAVANVADTSVPSTQEAFMARYENGCPPHQFDSIVQVSRAPNVMLIDGFVTPEETEVLIRVAEPLFATSTVVAYDNTPYNLNTTHRDSWTAYFPRTYPETDPDQRVVRCIEERAAAFQGHIPIENMEFLQVVKYHDSQHFREHYDWFDRANEEVISYGNRVTSFFVYLVANCTGGTTVFPYVKRPEREEFCGALKCKDDNGGNVEWLEFEPRTGSAVFWYNLSPDGVEDTFTMHAGAPVVTGTKIGMNIWTRERSFRG